MSKEIERLLQYIDKSKNIVFFGGAGVSTDSGIPDFRSKDGLYNVKDVQFEEYEPEYNIEAIDELVGYLRALVDNGWSKVEISEHPMATTGIFVREWTGEYEG